MNDGFGRDEALRLADTGGISSTQRDILLAAAERGSLPFSDYQLAVDETLECVRAAGHEPFDVQVVDTNGQPVITYGITASPRVAPEVFDETYAACLFRHSEAVEGLYSRNPGAKELSVEETEARFEEALSVCLTTGGYVVTETAGSTWIDLTGKVVYEQTDSATLACILGTGFLDVPRDLPLPD